MSDFDKYEAEGLAMHTPEFERDIAETLAEREAADSGPVHEVYVNTRDGVVRVDGRPLHRVTSVRVEHSAWGMPLVTVSFYARSVEGTFAAEARDAEATK